MSTTCEVSLGPLAIDGSNYSSWSAHVLNEIRTMGPNHELFVVASILPPHLRVDNIDLSTLSLEDLEYWQCNSRVANYICSTLSDCVRKLSMKKRK